MPETNMLYIPYIWQSCLMYILICVTYEITNINHVIRNLYIYFTKYFISLTYISVDRLQIQIIQPLCSMAIWPTIFHTCANIQPTALSTTHIIATYVPKINISPKLYIYAKITGTSYVSRSTAHIFNIYHWRNMNATLQIYITNHYTK